MHDGKTTRPRREELSVEVKPGFSEATSLTYPSKGNEAEGHKPSRLVIKFAQVADAFYRRKGNDLIYTHTITLEEALQSQPVKIKALDGRTIIVAIDEVITPQSVKSVDGEGMPINSDPTSDAMNSLKGLSEIPRGNLFIRFDIQFPSKISTHHKQSIIDILRQNAEENSL